MYKSSRSQGRHRPDPKNYGAPPLHAARGQEVPTQVASALKVKNFRKLIDAVGEEHLAVRLDLTLNRVQEMREGINLSDEMAYHIENMLGLSSGFLDQVNPTLTEAEVLRLKATPPEPKPEELSEPPRTESPETPAPAPTPAAPVQTALPVSVENPPRTETPPVVVIKKKSRLASTSTASSLGSDDSTLNQSTATSTESSADKSIAVQTLEEELAMTNATPEVAAATRATRAESSDPAELAQREIRRGNLLLLTTPAGAKSNLGRLTGLSAANVSHRLHGNKIFDKPTGQFFAQVLGLPEDWFETAHAEGDVPAATLQMLTDSKSVGHPATFPAKAPRAKNGERAARAKATGVIPTDLAGTRRRGRPPKADAENLAPTGIRLNMSSARAASAGDAPAAPAAAPAAAAPKAAAPKAPAAKAPAKSTQVAVSAPIAPPAAPPAASSPEAAPVALVANTPVVRAAARPEKVVPSGKVSVMVQALLQTLELKARDGRLSEDDAVRMLVEINML